MKKPPTQTEMEEARLSRNREYDDVFWVGVRTMKVFCRPSCPAKQPLDKNVIYFSSIREATAAGYRPCKRCRPVSDRVDATPQETRTAQPIFTRSINSPIGELILGANDLGLCLLEFADRRSLTTEVAVLQKLLCTTVVSGNNRYLDQIADELTRYFNGELTKFSTPLQRKGTAFQMSVWDELLQIPYGETISYGELAERIGRKGAQRAVGRANGDNRIAIVIPCHRVVQADGGLRGYGGGVWRKRYLLELERHHASITGMSQSHLQYRIAETF